MLLPVGLSYNANRERTISVESVVNMQPEVTYGGRQPVALVTCPGLTEFASAPSALKQGRGAISVGGVLYAVIGGQLYRFTDSGTPELLGTIDGSGICSMSASASQIHIAVFDTGYIFDLSTETLTRISDSAYPQGRTSVYLNGRFVVEDPTPGTTGRFYYSGVLDGLSWSALDFATAERKTDDAMSVWAYGESLVIFGTRSLEFWTPTATGFDPIAGALLPFGLRARWSVAEAGGSVFFLDSEGQVRVLQGYNSEVVSTPAVEAAIGSDADAEGCAYVFEGKIIYELSTAATTLCYDLTSSQMIGKPIWFKKSTAGSRWKGRNAVIAHGKLLQLGHEDTKVYELSRDAIPDAREFTVQVPVDDSVQRWKILDEVELIGRTGTGRRPTNPAILIDEGGAILVDEGGSVILVDETTPDGAVESPNVMLRVSRDNGYTEGEEKWKGLGSVGDYAKRVRWRRFGRFQQCAMTFRQTDQYDWTVLGVRLRGR